MKRFSVSSILVFLFFSSASFLAEPLQLRSPFEDPNFGFHFFCDPNRVETPVYIKGDRSGDSTIICKRSLDIFSNGKGYNLIIYSDTHQNAINILLGEIQCKKDICVLTEKERNRKHDFFDPYVRMVFRILDKDQLFLLSSNLRQTGHPENDNYCLPYEMSEDFFNEFEEYVFIR